MGNEGSNLSGHGTRVLHYSNKSILKKLTPIWLAHVDMVTTGRRIFPPEKYGDSQMSQSQSQSLPARSQPL